MATNRDLTVERMQNRQGLKINLPQPLRPGELGLCTDSKQLFIGADPLVTPIAGLQVYSGNYAEVQNTLTDNIFVITTNGTTVDTSAITGSSLWGSYPSIQNNVFGLDTNEDGFVNRIYIGILTTELTSGQFVIDLVALISGVADYLSYVQGTGKTVDADGGILFDTYPIIAVNHKEAAIVGSILNDLSTEPLGDVTSYLNIEVITEFSDWYPNFNPDIIAMPIIIDLPVSVGFTDVPNVTGGIFPALQYDTAAPNPDNSTDTMIIDYSLSYNGTGSYSSNGTLKVTTNIPAALVELVDENNTVTSGGFIEDVDFQATLVGGFVTVQYRHSLPGPVLMKVTTKRWLSF